MTPWVKPFWRFSVLMSGPSSMEWIPGIRVWSARNSVISSWRFSGAVSSFHLMSTMCCTVPVGGRRGTTVVQPVRRQAVRAASVPVLMSSLSTSKVRGGRPAACRRSNTTRGRAWSQSSEDGRGGDHQPPRLPAGQLPPQREEGGVVGPRGGPPVAGDRRLDAGHHPPGLLVAGLLEGIDDRRL